MIVIMGLISMEDNVQLYLLLGVSLSLSLLLGIVIGILVTQYMFADFLIKFFEGISIEISTISLDLNETFMVDAIIDRIPMDWNGT